MCCPVCESVEIRPFQRVDARDYWRCDACEVTFLDPSQLPDATTEQAQYRLHRNDPNDPAYRNFLARLADPLLSRLAPASRGLDYGCGPGPALAAMLREAGHSMAVFDPLFYNDADTLQRTYHFVTCTEVVEHFHHPLAEFAHLDALLEPGGWLAVMTRFLPDDRTFAQWHYRRDPTHVVFYREATFRVVAQRHGWQCDFPCADVALLQKNSV